MKKALNDLYQCRNSIGKSKFIPLFAGYIWRLLDRLLLMVVLFVVGITGVRKSCSKSDLDTKFCLTPLDLCSVRREVSYV